jgi:hypothetical protein
VETARTDRFFVQALDHEPADVPWSRVAAQLAINRRCAPGRELAREQRWYRSTALDDLVGIGIPRDKLSPHHTDKLTVGSPDKLAA